jgi:hypothetical protein
MDSIGRTNQAVMDLWQDTFSDDADELVPLIYPPIKRDVLLFVGMNPSFNRAQFQNILKDTSHAQINLAEFYHWRNRARFDLNTAQAIEVIAKSKHRFFAQFKRMAEYASTDWEHLDLFFYRHTNQNDFKHKVYTGNSLNEFGSSQLELSKELLIEARPQAIVVANASASDVFRAELGTRFDDKQGYDTIHLNGHVVPVFLASMLTGRRPMDVYSRERLCWHVKIVLDQIRCRNHTP